MIEKKELLGKLKEMRDDVRRNEQTIKNEILIAKLEAEITAIKCEIDSAVARRALECLKYWEQNRTFSLVNQEGQKRTEHARLTGNAIHDFWNVREEAYDLARWSFGL